MFEHSSVMTGYRLAAASAAILAGLCGCQSDSPRPAEAIVPGNAREILSPARLADGAADHHVLVTRLHLVSIEVPIGVASGSEEIWSYLDEESISQARTPVLALNGIRFGRGQADSWPDLARVFQEMTGRTVTEATMVALPGKPIPITIKSGQPSQTIFIIGQDRTITGDDYAPGDNVLTIVCTLDQTDPSKTMVTIVPQIRSSRRKPRYVNVGGQMMMISQPSIQSLTDLTVQAIVPSNDFIVIGPGANAARPSSVGHHFLVKRRGGVQFETVLAIKIEVVATAAKGSQ